MSSKCAFPKCLLILALLFTLSNTAFGAKEYRVKRGDTLSELARMYGVSLDELKSLNRLRDNRIRSGEVLVIPDPKAGGMRSERIKYRVLRGDTLSGIAKKFGVSVSDIKAQNNLRGSRIRAGQRLYITALYNFAHTQKAREYKVKRGDSLIRIAKMHGVSVERLKSVNGIIGSNIVIGTKLAIPGYISNRSDFYEDIKYKVKRGDSLSLISQKFGASVGDIKSANAMQSNTIRLGQVLVIPDGNDPRYQVIRIAERYLGAPYEFGGTSTVRGIDCSAFVKFVFGFLDVHLPRTAREIYKVGEVIPASELTVGDLVFFETYASFPSHVGIYMGNNKFIHASSRAKRVTVNSINERFYKKRYIGAKRLDIKDS